MKKYSLLLLTLAVFFTFSSGGVSSSYAANHIGDREYKIYSTILREKYSDDEAKSLVIIKTTSPEQILLQDSTTQSFSASLQKALKEYNAQNQAAKELTARFKVKAPVRLVDKKKIEAMFQQGVSGWDTFYKQFPDSSGHIRFSNIVMNAKKDQVLVFVQHLCGGRCASGKSYVLVKDKDAWKIVKEDILWLS